MNDTDPTEPVTLTTPEIHFNKYSTGYYDEHGNRVRRTCPMFSCPFDECTHWEVIT